MRFWRAEAAVAEPTRRLPAHSKRSGMPMSRGQDFAAALEDAQDVARLR